MSTTSIRPHIYRLRGEWTCALMSDGWAVYPYGKGRTPRGAYLNWRSLVRLPPELHAQLPPLIFKPIGENGHGRSTG